MNEFITWNNFLDYTTLVTIVFMLVQATKDMKLLKKIATNRYSILVSFILIIALNINFDTFKWFDLVLYLVNALMISTSANGVYNLDNKKGSEK